MIENDSVKFFIDGNRYSEESCANAIRYTRVDEDGKFNGTVTDILGANQIRLKGHYVHGRKHGRFAYYFDNGKAAFEGSFRDNLPIGVWRYFRKDGTPERTLLLTGSDTLLIKYLDSKGNAMVTNENGSIKGLANGAYLFSGEVEHGRATGKWEVTDHEGNALFSEELLNGKLLRGEVKNRQLGMTTYQTNSQIHFLVGTSLIEELETLHPIACPSLKHKPYREAQLDVESFRYELSDRTRQVVETELSQATLDGYGHDEKRLTIEFYINDDGVPFQIKHLSAWGTPFYNAISTSIRRHIRAPGMEGPLYLHLRMSFNGAVYQYRYFFSKERWDKE